NYDFRGTDAKIIDLQLKNGHFKLPLSKLSALSRDSNSPDSKSNTDSNLISKSNADSNLISNSNSNVDFSVFLKINVSTTFIGKFFQPEATLSFNQLPSDVITADGNQADVNPANVNQADSNLEKRSIHEYFENDAQGIRYINISSLVSLYLVESNLKENTVKNALKENLGESELKKAVLDIKLNGIRVSFKDQPIQLILFKNQELKKSKILIIAPHPDDAEIAAFGLYSSNQNSYIVTVTAGDAGTYQYDEIYSSRKSHFLKKGRLRTWNSISIPLLSGISPEQILNLGFFDGTLQKMFNVNPATVKALYTGISNINIFRKQNISPLGKSLKGNANWDSLVHNIEILLNKIQPDIIVAPYPAIDKHPDHKFSTIALFEAIKKAGIRSGYLYLYTNHFVLNEYYPYGKMGGVISLPPAFDHSLYFRSIYSHTLSPDRQKDKIMSLEAMNDLRPDTTWRFSQDAVKMAIASIRRDIFGQNISYYRRAVRNNELFFVIDINDIYNPTLLSCITGDSKP
ncbi:MAG: PIG-L family deacetylase, partial [Desulfamplus sp.]|nr:PIG-L family deacetylase [Desulfamplus sp.]